MYNASPSGVGGGGGVYYESRQYTPERLSPAATNYYYFDNAASTSMMPEVLNAMVPMFTNNYGNPEASHEAGKKARDIMEGCRGQIADALRVDSGEIYFTSGASESINTFIRGVCHSNCHRHRRKLVISAIEHKAVSATCSDMEREGYEVVLVPVLASGVINLAALAHAVTHETLLVCVIMGNNEVGVLQPMEHVARIAHASGALLFSDTTQIAGRLPVYPRQLGIDALCISGHKIHGPKGIGALYMSSTIDCAPIITGGHQERGQRAGTSNTPGIAGLASAILRNLSTQGQEQQREVQTKRDWIEAQLQHRIPNTLIHSKTVPRLNNISSVALINHQGEGMDKNEMMHYLNKYNIIVNTGSACNAGSDRSDVLQALGLSEAAEQSTIRVSLSPLTTWGECQLLVDTIENMLNNLPARRVSNDRVSVE